MKILRHFRLLVGSMLLLLVLSSALGGTGALQYCSNKGDLPFRVPLRVSWGGEV